jgi:hypothetical protein
LGYLEPGRRRRRGSALTHGLWLLVLLLVCLFAAAAIWRLV